MSNLIEQAFKHHPVDRTKAGLRSLLTRNHEHQAHNPRIRNVGSREVVLLQPGELPKEAVTILINASVSPVEKVK